MWLFALLPLMACLLCGASEGLTGGHDTDVDKPDPIPIATATGTDSQTEYAEGGTSPPCPPKQPCVEGGVAGPVPAPDTHRSLSTAEEWAMMQKLIPSDGAANDQFGYSVSVSGNVMVVGAPVDGSGNTMQII